MILAMYMLLKNKTPKTGPQNAQKSIANRSTLT